MPDGKQEASRLYDCCTGLGGDLEDPARARLELGGASRTFDEDDPLPATNLPGVRVLNA